MYTVQMWRTPNNTNIYFVQAHNDDAIYVLNPKNPKSSKDLENLYTSLSKSTASSSSYNPIGHFDKKTEKSSADIYFHYYGMLQHQQNMLQDYIRTGTYFSAITENSVDFRNKIVMDVGCGSGILSLFAAQAGAKKVYAVEASNMTMFAKQLADANPEFGKKIQFISGKVEELSLPEKVDVLVSEPMGTLLVNERMIESYLYARDHFLVPGGKMFPSLGKIYVSAFSDEVLHAEIGIKSAFWEQSSFYGVDLTCLRDPATNAYYSQVVIDQIPPHILVSNCMTHALDFMTCLESDLHDISIPLSLQVIAPCTIHGIATWFDVLFDGTAVQRYLSTSPGLPLTHWFQLRCVLQRPLVVRRAGQTVTGELRLVAHKRQSYDVYLTLKTEGVDDGGAAQESTGIFDLKDPFYRFNSQAGSWSVDGTTTPVQNDVNGEMFGSFRQEDDIGDAQMVV